MCLDLPLVREAPPLTATPHSFDPQKFSTQNAALSAEAAFKNGRKIKSITFIIDENPMPVAAAFRFGDNRERASLGLDIRLDQALPVVSWWRQATRAQHGGEIHQGVGRRRVRGAAGAIPCSPQKPWATSSSPT